MSWKYATSWLDARRWSLTVRMTVFFGAAIAVIVICVSAMMYAELVHQLHEQQEIELREEIGDLKQVLRSADGKPAPQDDTQLFAWQLRAPNGRIIEASHNAAGVLPLLEQVSRPGSYLRVTEGRRAFLLACEPSGSAHDGTMLRALLDVSHDDTVLRRYLAKLLSVAALAICASVALGWMLARRGLAPVRAISMQIGHMGAQGRHTPIAQQTWPAELRLLADTFDQLMARIDSSFEQLSRFSSDLAHEFRSPINNLVAAASVTLGRARSAEEYQATLAVMVDEGSRLSRMVGSMLFLARTDNAKQLLQREALSSETAFGKLIDFFGIAADEQGVILERNGTVHFQADPLLLHQALSNLLANALRYTARGGTIRLCAEQRGDWVAIIVSDDGAGIAAAHLPFLFDRFYRADAARSSADSTGLGLAVVRSIAELHGGTVMVRSSLGEGAAFELVLPKGA